MKALTEQAEPFAEALLGDLALEHLLVDRARYLKSLAVAAGNKEVQDLADSLIEAHSATVVWLTTVLAEDALGGPAALRRTPDSGGRRCCGQTRQPAGTAGHPRVRPGADHGPLHPAGRRRRTGPRQPGRGHRGQDAVRLAGRRPVGGRESSEPARGAEEVADALHNLRGSTGVLEASELPIAGYDELNVNDAVAAVKELDEPADIRVIIAYEEFHKDRQARGVGRSGAAERHRPGNCRDRISRSVPIDDNLRYRRLRYRRLLVV